MASPKLREGSYFPSLLQPRRRIDTALYAMTRWFGIDGVSTPKGGPAGVSFGNGTGIPRSTVSRICAEIDETVHEFL